MPFISLCIEFLPQDQIWCEDSHDDGNLKKKLQGGDQGFKQGKWKKEQERDHENFKSMIFWWMSCTYTYEIAEKFPK